TGGNFLRRAAIDRHYEDFVVRARGYDLVDVARIRDFLTVRRDRIHVLAAEIERRRIEITWREIARLYPRPCGPLFLLRRHARDGPQARGYRICANNKQMAPLEFGERVPMPIKEARKNFRFHFALLYLFVALLVARIILAIGIDCRHEHDVLAVG